MPKPSQWVSIVIPAYNEEQRIAGTLTQWREYFTAQPYQVEFIVVDDGSRDNTSGIVRESFPDVEVISYQPNRGKGYAVKQGMLAARGDYRFFCDADASTPIEEIEKVWPEFDAGAAVVIGSRALRGSDIRVHQAWYRENMGRCYNLLLRGLGLTSFPDTQCGFKGFTAESCGIIFPRQTICGFGADCEILYIARKHGLSIAQVPVRWQNSAESRVHPIFDSMAMIREAFAIRRNIFLGKYE